MEQIPVLVDPTAPNAHEHAVAEAERVDAAVRKLQRDNVRNYVAPETGENPYCRSHEERSAGLS